MNVGVAYVPQTPAETAHRPKPLADRLGAIRAGETFESRAQAPQCDAHVVRRFGVVRVQDRRRFGKRRVEERHQDDLGGVGESHLGVQSLEKGCLGQRSSLPERPDVRYVVGGPGALMQPEREAMVTQAPPGAKKILIVDDESAILQTLRFNLERNGYIVTTAGDGRSGVALVASERPDLIVLDIMLPILDGIEACREIRKLTAAPIIMLTAKDQEIDKVLALELGADDYVTKPFSLHEFMARVKARLRRSPGAGEIGRSEAIEAGEIVLDPSRQALSVRGQPVALAPKEFSLLQILMENRGRVVTRLTLLDKVWGYDFEGEHQTISVHVRWLREKIEVDPNKPRHIITVRSRGYMFKD